MKNNLERCISGKNIHQETLEKILIHELWTGACILFILQLEWQYLGGKLFLSPSLSQTCLLTLLTAFNQITFLASRCNRKQERVKNSRSTTCSGCREKDKSTEVSDLTNVLFQIQFKKNKMLHLCSIYQ